MTLHPEFECWNPTNIRSSITLDIAYKKKLCKTSCLGRCTEQGCFQTQVVSKRQTRFLLTSRTNVLEPSYLSNINIMFCESTYICLWVNAAIKTCSWSSSSRWESLSSRLQQHSSSNVKQNKISNWLRMYTIIHSKHTHALIVSADAGWGSWFRTTRNQADGGITLI